VTHDPELTWDGLKSHGAALLIHYSVADFSRGQCIQFCQMKRREVSLVMRAPPMTTAIRPEIERVYPDTQRPESVRSHFSVACRRNHFVNSLELYQTENPQ
jgi:hypothetical protein